MLCRICYQAQATIHVLERPTDDPGVESHYCLACYERTVVHPPTGWIVVDGDPPPIGPPAFPLSRFTIKGLMAVAALFAFLNAALAMLMRSHPIRGTPARVEALTVRAFLVASTFLAVLLVELAALAWLRRWYGRNINGGRPGPFPGAMERLREAGPAESLLLTMFIAWPLLFVMLLIPRWISSRIAYRLDPMIVAAMLPLFLIVGWILVYAGLVAVTRRR